MKSACFLKPVLHALAALLAVAMFTPATRAQDAATDRQDPPVLDREPAAPDGELPRGDRPRGPEGAERPPHMPPRDLWARMSEAERQEMRTFIEQEFPLMHEELERISKDGDARYERRMARLAPEMRRMMEALSDNPERGRLVIRERVADMQFRRLALAWRNAPNEERKAKIRGELTKVAGEMFAVRIDRRELELKDLQKRLADLQARIAEARENRDRLIEQEITDRLRDERPEASEHREHPRPGEGDFAIPEDGPRPKGRPGRPGGPRNDE